MRTILVMLFLGVMLPVGVARAASRTGGVVVVSADSLDGGGQRATSAQYCVDGSLDSMGGVSAGNEQVAKAGYIGQLAEATSLTPVAAPSPIQEAGAAQLSGVAGLDDGTVVVLSGGEVQWAPASFPLAAIAPNGAASSGVVYADTAGAFTGAYLGVTGTGTLVVLDNDADNYGIYAGDQVNDGWQVRYFGENNSNGQASAMCSNGQSVAYNYLADLNPTNPFARFVITTFPRETPARIYFNPSSTNRVYSLRYSQDMNNGSWGAVAGQVHIPGGVPFLIDTNAMTSRRFYCVDVGLP